jgi:hypothetical protein
MSKKSQRNRKRNKIGRNDDCPCGAKKPDGSVIKYKNCCELKKKSPVPQEVLDYFKNNPPIPEPFEKGGFLTGRPFITETFQGKRARAVGNQVFLRPLDETFHLFILRTLSETLTQKWIESEEKKSDPHQVVQWFQEAQKIISKDKNELNEKVRGVKLTGNMRALLALAYDFYTLKHCSAPVLPKLLNRLRNPQQFQGARYEIAVAGLVCRAGFNIEWVNSVGKHGEFIGTHKVTGDKAVFEAKSHHRQGVLGIDGEFNSESTKTKVVDHVREALEQTQDDDLPLVLFDDLNLPLTSNVPSNEKGWFKEIDEHLKKYGFLYTDIYKRCALLSITNFSWHFHYEVPPEKNELVNYFHINGKHSLKQETVLKYLDLSAKQYGYVPTLLHEFEDKKVEINFSS